MRVSVRLFARLRDIAGAGELERDVPTGATVSAVWQILADEFPELGRYATSISTAVNAEYARMDAVLHEGDEVAFLPPVSGGLLSLSRVAVSYRQRAQSLSDR